MDHTNLNFNHTIGLLCGSDSFGGLEMNLVRVGKWLQQLGASIVLLCRPGTPIATYAVQSGLRVDTINPHRKFLDVSAGLKLSKLLGKHHINSLILSLNSDISVCGLAKRFSRNNVKVLYMQQMQIGPDKRDIVHTRRYAALDYWLAPLEYLAREVRVKTRLDQRKIKVLPLCVEVDSFVSDLSDRSLARQELDLHFPEGTIVFGILGRIDRLKGQGMILESMARLKERGHNIGLVIMGAPTNNPEAEAFAHALQKQVSANDLLAQVVKFRPFSTKTGSFYSAIDIFIMGSATETYGMVTIEAMIAGKTVMATDTPASKELLANGQYGVLYPFGDPNKFVELAEGLIGDSTIREDLASRSCAYARQVFHNKRQVEGILKLLQM